MRASPGPIHDNILMEDDTERPARTDAQRRLDIEIAGDKLVAGARPALLGGFADGANKIALLSPHPNSVPTLSRVESPTPLKSCQVRSEEHTSELQSLMRTSYAVFCLKQKNR